METQQNIRKIEDSAKKPFKLPFRTCAKCLSKQKIVEFTDWARI